MTRQLQEKKIKQKKNLRLRFLNFEQFSFRGVLRGHKISLLTIMTDCADEKYSFLFRPCQTPNSKKRKREPLSEQPRCEFSGTDEDEDSDASGSESVSTEVVRPGPTTTRSSRVSKPPKANEDEYLKDVQFVDEKQPKKKRRLGEKGSGGGAESKDPTLPLWDANQGHGAVAADLSFVVYARGVGRVGDTVTCIVTFFVSEMRDETLGIAPELAGSIGCHFCRMLTGWDDPRAERRAAVFEGGEGKPIRTFRAHLIATIEVPPDWAGYRDLISPLVCVPLRVKLRRSRVALPHLQCLSAAPYVAMGARKIKPVMGIPLATSELCRFLFEKPPSKTKKQLVCISGQPCSANALFEFEMVAPERCRRALPFDPRPNPVLSIPSNRRSHRACRPPGKQVQVQYTEATVKRMLLDHAAVVPISAEEDTKIRELWAADGRARPTGAGRSVLSADTPEGRQARRVALPYMKRMARETLTARKSIKTTKQCALEEETVFGQLSWVDSMGMRVEEPAKRRCVLDPKTRAWQISCVAPFLSEGVWALSRVVGIDAALRCSLNESLRPLVDECTNNIAVAALFPEAPVLYEAAFAYELAHQEARKQQPKQDGVTSRKQHMHVLENGTALDDTAKQLLLAGKQLREDGNCFLPLDPKLLERTPIMKHGAKCGWRHQLQPRLALEQQNDFSVVRALSTALLANKLAESIESDVAGAAYVIVWQTPQMRRALSQALREIKCKKLVSYVQVGELIADPLMLHKHPNLCLVLTEAGLLGTLTVDLLNVVRDKSKAERFAEGIPVAMRSKKELAFWSKKESQPSEAPLVAILGCRAFARTLDGTANCVDDLTRSQATEKFVADGELALRDMNDTQKLLSRLNVQFCGDKKSARTLLENATFGSEKLVLIPSFGNMERRLFSSYSLEVRALDDRRPLNSKGRAPQHIVVVLPTQSSPLWRGANIEKNWGFEMRRQLLADLIHSNAGQITVVGTAETLFDGLVGVDVWN